jgi:hypothetical protein
METIIEQLHELNEKVMIFKHYQEMMIQEEEKQDTKRVILLHELMQSK